MLRMSKQADYGLVLLSHFAQKGAGMFLSARDLADESGLPLPTVRKILKELARGRILESSRGRNGGYCLTRSAQEVTVASIVEALDGPIGVVDCSVMRTCHHEPRCPVKGPAQRLNALVRATFENLSLGELVVSPTMKTSCTPRWESSSPTTTPASSTPPFRTATHVDRCRSV